ncbi:WXG100 family type VII secretion target [Aequitasia blattaphilus]|uniref:ESAT-6-like protein n=1 Tax=Aequitasia blattaphilus TaxID=2949332 RepID=A0ABT1EB57_9FIRM|nr:WXG100 family type VII secretion target [Aequitasia blattaphilus]MCP1103065.1 WXG100 family type VII secretion target [Aequitasia blattaphilus]MCR8615705.1 WXG100 family type VII secretion target [Aequitasia blattaphilus]
MLRVDYDALAYASRTLSEQGDTFESCIGTMTSVVNGLPDIWEADTCDRYVEQYNEASKTLNEVRELIREMSEQMQKISDNFRGADVDMAGQM